MGTQTVTKRDGSRTTYEGEWHEDKQHGKGTSTRTLQDGSVQFVYVGEWQDGKRDGEGELTWPGEHDAKFTGTWQEGNVQDGKGLLFGAPKEEDGSVWQRWEGTVRAGRADSGTGSVENKDGRWTYVGELHEGKRHGTGTETLTVQDGGIVYHGKWQDNARHGEGTETVTDKHGSHVFTGKWDQGAMQEGSGHVRLLLSDPRSPRHDAVIYDGSKPRLTFDGSIGEASPVSGDGCFFLSNEDLCDGVWEVCAHAIVLTQWPLRHPPSMHHRMVC